MHVRAQIRQKVVEVLTGLPTTTDQVFPGRTRPLAANHAPTLLVYVTDERSDPDAMGILGRELTLAVEGRVTSADVPDGTLDQIALEVEPAMVARPLLGGVVSEVTLMSTLINTQAPGDAQAGEIIMKFRVAYRTTEIAPDTAV